MTEDERLEIIYEKLLASHLRARKAKRRTTNEHRFEINLFQNLYKLAQEVVNYEYEPSPGIAFIVQSPVMREIFAAPYRDRIIHHFIFTHVEDFWERRFIHYSCSCRKGKGTLFAIRSVEKFVRKATVNYTEEAVVLKYDLTGYFMSLPRCALYRKAIDGLRKQFKGRERNILFGILKFLWRKVIMNDPTIGIKIRGKLRDWEKLPRRKSLFFQPERQGIVIGNLTSQLLSNIYLNDFDHYMQEAFPDCFYVRYVDDFMIICNVRLNARAKSLAVEMEAKLNAENLKINRTKSYCQSVQRGIAFVGVVIYPWRTVIGKRLKRNLVVACTRYREGTVRIETIVSYVGFIKHHSSYNLARCFLYRCLYCETIFVKTW